MTLIKLSLTLIILMIATGTWFLGESGRQKRLLGLILWTESIVLFIIGSFAIWTYE